MLLINPGNLLFTNQEYIISSDKNYALTDIDSPYISISVHINKKRNDIIMLKGKYKLTGTFDFTIDDPDTIGNIYNYLTDNPNISGGASHNLCEYLTAYILTIEKDEKEIISQTYKSTPSENRNINQIIFDGFIYGISTYITFLKLLTYDEIWDELPYQITLPAIIETGNILNQNMFKYMEIPLQTWGKTVKGPLKFVIDQIINFMNIYGNLFDEGPTVDINKILLETVIGFSMNTIEKADKLKDDVKKINSDLLHIKEKIDKSVKDNVNVLCEEANKVISNKIENLTHQIETFTVNQPICKNIVKEVIQNIDGIIPKMIEDHLNRMLPNSLPDATALNNKISLLEGKIDTLTELYIELSKKINTMSSNDKIPDLGDNKTLNDLEREKNAFDNRSTFHVIDLQSRSPGGRGMDR